MPQTLASFGDFVREGLAALVEELPWCAARMVTALGRRDVLLTVDGEPVRVRADGARVRVIDAAEFSPRVTLTTDRVTVLRLADAETSVLDAVLDGSIVLRGDVDDLVAFYEGLQGFLHGAVRSPSFPRLLERYRRWAAPRDAHSTQNELLPR